MEKAEGSPHSHRRNRMRNSSKDSGQEYHSSEEQTREGGILKKQNTNRKTSAPRGQSPTKQQNSTSNTSSSGATLAHVKPSIVSFEKSSSSTDSSEDEEQDDFSMPFGENVVTFSSEQKTRENISKGPKTFAPRGRPQNPQIPISGTRKTTKPVNPAIIFDTSSSGSESSEAEVRNLNTKSRKKTQPVNDIRILSPSVPKVSTRVPVNHNTDIKDIIPTTLLEKSLPSVLLNYPLVGTQFNVVHARETYIKGAKIFMRRNLSYNQRVKRTARKSSIWLKRLQEGHKFPETQECAPSKDLVSLKMKTSKRSTSTTNATQAPIELVKIDYTFVLVYPSGHHYEARDMVALTNPRKGHSCIFCPLLCDSLVHLVRHFDGLHPGLGYQFDPETRRIYVWFAPELDFVRLSVPGMVDHWSMLKFKTRDDGSKFRYYRNQLSYPNGRPVLHWTSLRYGNQRADSLPIFNLDHLLGIYRIPVDVKTTRRLLHTNAARSIRPDLVALQGYDSDDENEWQDEYEYAQIYEYIDLDIGEQEFMCLWNAFTRPRIPIFSRQMVEVLREFVVHHAMEIEMLEAYPVLCAKLVVLQKDKTITSAESLDIIRTFRDTLECKPYVLRGEKNVLLTNKSTAANASVVV